MLKIANRNASAEFPKWGEAAPNSIPVQEISLAKGSRSSNGKNALLPIPDGSFLCKGRHWGSPVFQLRLSRDNF